jgi:nucleotide-binding universal stress UspA family protein
MMTIEHILFPFDFSSPGFQAAGFVEAAAKRFGARVTLLGAISPVPDISAAQQMEQDLQSRLDGALTRELAGVDVERIATVGDPAEKIVEFARANEVDLIMMPTYGCGFFRSLLIGSVAAKVLHDARCPVWTAAHAEEQRSRPAPRAILCAVAGTDGTGALIEWAGEFSERMGATLKLLHVVPPISDWLALPGEKDLQERLRGEAHRRLEALLERANNGATRLCASPESRGVDAPLKIAVGPIAGAVAEEARQEEADLVIIGRGSLQSPLGRLRTHAYGIIQRSPCPVLSV